MKIKKQHSNKLYCQFGTTSGIRTRIAGVRGQCTNPYTMMAKTTLILYQIFLIKSIVY